MANDIDETTREWLTGARGDGRSTDLSPIDGLVRAWPAMANTQEGKELGAAIVRRLTDGDAELRYRALQFLFAIPVCDLTYAVLPLVRGDRSLFRGVYVGGDDKSLEFWLLWILAKLLDGKRQDVLEAARSEVLNPAGEPAPVAGRLAKVDSEWVRAHRDKIENLHPDTSEAFDNNLK